MEQVDIAQARSIVIFSEFPLRYPGGVERLIKMMCTEFEKSGFLIKVVHNNKLLPHGYLNLDENAYPCNVETKKFFRPGLLKFLYQDFPELGSIPTSSTSVSIIFLRRVPPRKVLHKINGSGAKVIFCIHGIALERFRLTYFRIMVHQILMRIMLRQLAKFSFANIFVQVLTPHMRSYLLDADANPSNVYLIEDKFDVPHADIVRNDDHFNIVFIGRMENLQKGIKILMKTILQLYRMQPKIGIRIIGTGKDSKILGGLPENAEYFGSVDENEKKKLLQNANLALITSLLEPFSLVALEYLSLGIPIVTTSASGPAFILGKDKDFGTVASFRPKEIARCVISYYQSWEHDKNEYFEMRKRILEKSHVLFRPDEMFEEYVEMVTKVIQAS